MSHPICAVAVTALLAALPLTLQAQQADLTPAQVATIKREVADAVHTYYRLFSERNMQAMGDRVYHVPWMQLGARGIDVDTTAEAVVKRNSASLEGLLTRGWDRSAFAVPVVCVLNPGAAIASGTFKRFHKDGSVISESGITYLFGKTPEGWKIVSYAGHATTKLVTCND